MKFSVLIANYNNGHLFQDCYNSLLAQKYSNWEAIIIDDASTDNSVEVIKKIIKNDPRFFFVQNEKNSGVGFTKAKLIEMAKGELCGFLDPDDALQPNALYAAVEIFTKDQNTVLTYSRLAKCDDRLNIIHHFKSARQVPNGQRDFFNFPIQIAPFVAFRKSVYDTCIPMNPNFLIAEDQDLYLKMYEKGAVKFIDQVDYLYRSHSGGISQNKNKEKSYRYWAEAIFSAMQRRNIKKLNGREVPENYHKPQEIFDLLDYQNTIPFRIKKKCKVLLQALFN